MSLGDMLKFEGFNLGNMWDKIKDNPARLLYGGIDPASTKVWNKVLGRDDQPLVDQLGGPAADTWGKAREAGIDTGTSKTLHGAAHVIAGGYGAGGLAGLMGGLGGAGGAAGGTGGLGGTAGAGSSMNPGYVKAGLQLLQGMGGNQGNDEQMRAMQIAQMLRQNRNQLDAGGEQMPGFVNMG